MDNFNFNLFKYFYYVVLYNGVTNASKNLSVAQPSLSLSIKNLESQLNKKLIDRDNKHFTLTDEGNQLFETIKPIFENIEQCIDFNNEKKFIELNIAIRYSYATPILSNIIKSFKIENPKVKINVDLYSKLNINKAENHEYDVVVDNIEYLNQIEDFTSEILCKLPNYFICGDDLFEEYKNIFSASEIDNAPFICYRPSRKNGKLKQFCYNNNISFLEICNINESDLYFKLIKDNLGIGISNKLLLTYYNKDNSLHIIKTKEDLFEDQLAIAYYKKSKLIENFIEKLKINVEENLK